MTFISLRVLTFLTLGLSLAGAVSPYVAQPSPVGFAPENHADNFLYPRGKSSSDWTGSSDQQGSQKGSPPSEITGGSDHDSKDKSNGGKRKDKDQGGNKDHGDHKNPPKGEEPKSPHPSGKPKRRALRKRLETMSATELATEICPQDLSGCPIAPAGSLSALPTTLSEWFSGFECVDLKADLRSCGGCASLAAKHDCTSIPGSDTVSCVEGSCVVHSCNSGYLLDDVANTCVPN